MTGCLAGLKKLGKRSFAEIELENAGKRCYFGIVRFEKA